jgi:hypothetical protein
MLTLQLNLVLRFFAGTCPIGPSMIAARSERTNVCSGFCFVSKCEQSVKNSWRLDKK